MFKSILSSTIIFCFILTTLGPLPQAHAQSVETSLMASLPVPGTMINLSPAYEPVMIKGLTVHKDNPFLFDFIVDIGQDKLSGELLKKEGEKLIKYFLASLAIPDKDVWVNLSPYEKNRMIPQVLGQTDMGRDLLEQDYILKQITASLIYPEKQLGKLFWDKVYSKAQEMYGTTQIPINTFNKVWIMADRAEIFEHNQTAFVVDSHLKVMLEEDYLALQKHSPSFFKEGVRGSSNNTHSIASQIVKQIILPELETEVNTGKNFAPLRQIFNSVILSSWYKKNLKQALLNQVYANKAKVKGIDLNDPTVKQQIYEQYLKAYKIGVFNYIKEDINAASNQPMPRKYFSGGITELNPHPAMTSNPMTLLPLSQEGENGELVNIKVITSIGRTTPAMSNTNAAMNGAMDEKLTKLRNAFVGEFLKSPDGIELIDFYKERNLGNILRVLFRYLSPERISQETELRQAIYQQNGDYFPELKEKLLPILKVVTNLADVTNLSRLDSAKAHAVSTFIEGPNGRALIGIFGEQHRDLIEQVTARYLRGRKKDTFQSGIETIKDNVRKVLELTGEDTYYPLAKILKGKVIILRGIGGVSGNLLGALLESGAKLVVTDISDVNIKKFSNKYQSYVDSHQLVFLQEEKTAHGFTRKYIDLKALRSVGIKHADILMPAAQGPSIYPGDRETLKALGIKLIVGSENDLLADKEKLPRELKEDGITLVPDFIGNSGGVRACVAGIILQDVGNSFIAHDIGRITTEILKDSLETGRSTLEIAQERSRKIIDQWDVAEKLPTLAEAEGDIRSLEMRVHGNITLERLKHQPLEDNRRNPFRLDGLVLKDGTKVKVYAYKEQVPQEIRDLWDDHYAIFQFTNEELGYVSYAGIHRLTRIVSPLKEFDGQYRTIGGTRFAHYKNPLEAFRLGLVLPREMSEKLAGAGLNMGGNKNIIVAPTNLEPDYRLVTKGQELWRNAILTSDAKAVNTVDQLIGGGPFVAQDMNVSEDDNNLRAEEAASAPNAAKPYGFYKIPSPATAIGVYAALVAGAEFAFALPSGNAAMKSNASHSLAAHIPLLHTETWI